jgi:hypothetical protein
VLGVAGKLVKYVVHLSKRKTWKKFIFFLTNCPNSAQTVFGLKEFYKLKFDCKQEVINLWVKFHGMSLKCENF